MSAINDPLGQTHSPASSDHYSHLKIVLFNEILKRGRTDGRTDGPRAKIGTTACGSALWINCRKYTTLIICKLKFTILKKMAKPIIIEIAFKIFYFSILCLY